MLLLEQLFVVVPRLKPVILKAHAATVLLQKGHVNTFWYCF
jgi:hypothetical protein